jgi:hypothetical protein
MSSATRSSCWEAAGLIDPAPSASGSGTGMRATDPGEDRHSALINLENGFLQ